VYRPHQSGLNRETGRQPIDWYSRAVTQSQPGSSHRRQTIWIVLPAYNEETDLPVLLTRVEESMLEANLQYRIVIVDDGSKDRTLEIARSAAERMPIHIEVHSENMGLGATIRDGLLTACQMADPKDILVTLDADNSHTPELVLRMVRQIREGHDVVIASRYQRGSHVRGVPLARRVLSYWGGMLFKVVFPIHGVRDYTSGYRAYRAELLQSVVSDAEHPFFDQDGFQVMVDILLKLRRVTGVIFGEVPLILRYDLKSGASKMDVGATMQNTLKLMVKRRFE
jgi:dolichol-phosphate mannosyltransferase